MNNVNNTNTNTTSIGRATTGSNSDYLDLIAVWRLLTEGKWSILIVSIFSLIGSVLYTLTLPDVYRADVTLVSVEESSSMAESLTAGLGGIASMAGLDFAGDQVSKADLALEIMKSRKFITDFVDNHKLKPYLFAVQEWDKEENQIIFDSTIYDEKSDSWVRKVDPPLEKEPSVWEVYDVFQNILYIEHDSVTKITNISIEHQSPELAAKWLNMLVKDVNEHMRLREQHEAKKSITYIEEQLNKNTIAELQASFYSLIEEQTKKIMLSHVRDEYVFNTIDPAVAPQFKFGPKRALICILGALLGAVLSSFAVIAIGLINSSVVKHDESLSEQSI